MLCVLLLPVMVSSAGEEEGLSRHSFLHSCASCPPPAVLWGRNPYGSSSQNAVAAIFGAALRMAVGWAFSVPDTYSSIGPPLNIL